jgi:hypothetical protein
MVVILSIWLLLVVAVGALEPAAAAVLVDLGLDRLRLLLIYTV